MAIIQRQSNIEFDRWEPLSDAIDDLIKEGIYERLVNIHTEIVEEPDGFRYSLYLMHGSMSGPRGYRRFLPWHRAYLIAFERELRQIDASLSIPYWDWNVDEGNLRGFSDLLGMSSGRTSERERGNFFTSEAEIEWLLSFSNYYSFARELENGPHNRGHRWIGGTMAEMESPKDPAFWFHHAQVDRIWALWQERNRGRKAHLSGKEARLDPWETEFNVDSVDDISQLGADSYEYV